VRLSSPLQARKSIYESLAARKLLLRGRVEFGLDVEGGRGVRGLGGQGEQRMNDEGRRMNAGPKWGSLAGFEATRDGGGEIHGGFPTLMSIAFLPAAARFFWQRVFVGDEDCSRKRSSSRRCRLVLGLATANRSSLGNLLILCQFVPGFTSPLSICMWDVFSLSHFFRRPSSPARLSRVS
jgi:hypothetical protein